MSPAESIPYEDMSEVHPGADPVNSLAGYGNSRYLYEMSDDKLWQTSRVEPRIHRLYP